MSRSWIFARTAVIAILAGYAVAGLWPFNFYGRNHAQWLPGRPGIQLRALSVVHSGKPVPAPRTAAVSIELLLRNEAEPSGNLFPILALYDGQIPENLLIAQWKSGILLRSVVFGTEGRRRYRESGINAALPKGKTSFVTLTSGPGGTSWYLDGRPAVTTPTQILRPAALQGEWILGDAAIERSSWVGKIFGLAIYDRVLDASDVQRHYRLWAEGKIGPEKGTSALYRFDEGEGDVVRDHSGNGQDLVIPERFRALRKEILQAPWEDWRKSLSHARDIAVNVVGFVPFGFFLFIYRDGARPGHRTAAVFVTVIAAAAVSLGIELAQVWLPTRNSSMTDLFCNIAGGVTGIATAKRTHRRHREENTK